jgi:transcriptional regulator of met regulon
MDALQTLLAKYRKSDEQFRKNAFTIAVKAVLKAMGEVDLANSIKNDEDAYAIAKELVDKFFRFKGDPLISDVDLRDIVKRLDSQSV